MEPDHWDKALSHEEGKEDALENKMTIYKLQLAKEEDFGFGLKMAAKKISWKITV